MKHTGLPLEKVHASMERDNFMSPKEAQDFGLIDKILEHPPEVGEKENAGKDQAK